eukprot:3934570-Rhodomonas_salina.3
MSLEDLLPFSFGPADLGKDQRLLSSQHHSLILDAAHSPAESALDRLTELALEFANASYSVSTSSTSALAKTRSSDSVSVSRIHSARRVSQYA